MYRDVRVSREMIVDGVCHLSIAVAGSDLDDVVLGLKTYFDVLTILTHNDVEITGDVSLEIGFVLVYEPPLKGKDEAFLLHAPR